MKNKILIIDDNHDIADKLKRFLGENGYEAFVTADWAEGFETVYRNKPDLIILDMQFADEWGSRFFRMFTEVEEFKKTPLIIKTGKSRTHIPEKKAVASFTKPYDLFRLLETVDSNLGVTR